ncbi:hypothetical protein MLD38_039813 [Melastoma candidum]|uniref:Uncharacterized protein n=1 Tax=Melastoma candidum TaxID=119954 RepID=A0ACB9L3P5_9MYRT|nr:hypothetical protein MLD38_039813 [Melastoma candidum]
MVIVNFLKVPKRTEIQGMLDFHPDRVEICLTSNIRTGTISSIDIRHFADSHRDKHPMVPCTDDAGVFSTSISREYRIAASAFGIKREEVYQLTSDAIRFILVDDGVKTESRTTLVAFSKRNCL